MLFRVLLCLVGAGVLCDALKVPVSESELFAFHTREVLWSQFPTDDCSAVGKHYDAHMNFTKGVISVAFPHMTKRIKALQNTNVDFIFEGYIASGLIHALSTKIAKCNALTAKKVDEYLKNYVDSMLVDIVSSFHSTEQLSDNAAILSIPALAMLYIQENEHLATELWNVFVSEVTPWMEAHAKLAEECKDRNFPFDVSSATDDSLAGTAQNTLEILRKRYQRDENRCPNMRRLSGDADVVADGESISCDNIETCEVDVLDPPSSLQSILKPDVKAFIKEFQDLGALMESWMNHNPFPLPTLAHLLNYYDKEVLPRLVIHGIDIICPPSWWLDTACYPLRYLFVPSAKQQLQRGDAQALSTWLPSWQTIIRNSNLALIKQSIQARASYSNISDVSISSTLTPSLWNIFNNYTDFAKVVADADVNKTSQSQVAYTALRDYVESSRKGMYFCIDGVAQSASSFWDAVGKVLFEMSRETKFFEILGYVVGMIFTELVKNSFLSSTIGNTIMTAGAVLLGCCIVGGIFSCVLMYYYFWWTVVFWVCVIIYFAVSPLLALILLVTYWFYKRKG